MVSNSVIETLEKGLGNLVERWTQVNNQINIESDYEKRQLLKMRADELLQEMDDLEAKIKQRKNPINNTKQNYVNIQDDLPEIDFKEAVDIVESIKQKFGKDLGAALFLLEDSFRLSGNLLIKKIKKVIFDNITKNVTVDCILCSESNEYGLIKGIGSYFGINLSSQTISEYNQEVIEAICKSLQNGSFIFIELNRWNIFPKQKEIITWFINNFWIPLNQQIKLTIEVKKLRRVKVIAVIDIHSQLKPECQYLPFYCNSDDFDSQKLIILPMRDWTEKEIYDWIDNYYLDIETSQMETIANYVFSTTQG